MKELDDIWSPACASFRGEGCAALRDVHVSREGDLHWILRVDATRDAQAVEFAQSRVRW